MVIFLNGKLRKVNSQPNNTFRDLRNTKPKQDNVHISNGNINPAVQSPIKEGAHQVAVKSTVGQ